MSFRPKGEIFALLMSFR